MTPQDYTALETALTQHAALETALAHNRDEVTAPILTRLRRENGTLRRENESLRQRNARLQRRNLKWQFLYAKIWHHAWEHVFVMSVFVCCRLICFSLVAGFSPIDFFLTLQTVLFDLIVPGWSGEAFITNYWLRLQELSSNSSEYQSTESHSHAAGIEAEGEFEPSLLLVIAVFTLPAFVANLILAQDPVYNVAFLADRVWTFCKGCSILSIAIVPLWVIYAFWDLPAGGPHYWWWHIQFWIFDWDSCAGLTACYDEHGRPCQWVAPLAKDYCTSLDELYG